MSTNTAIDTKRRPVPPTVALTKSYLEKWETLEKYRLQEDALTRLFQELCPSNDNILDVLLKVSALNDFYSTNILSTHPVAKRIVDLNVDQRIAAGDHSIVNEIATVSFGAEIRNFYSFASKYCNHHSPESFPIYDSYVEKMLLHFQKAERFAVFKRADLKQYDRFVGIIKAFRTHYSLEQFSLRQIDIYLWLAGKESFGKYDSPQKKDAEHIKGMTSSSETFDSLWEYCAANNRLVPRPSQWNELYGMLKNTFQKPAGGWEPPVPLILAAWNHSMPIEKQLRFKEHIQWASDQNQIAEVGTYLRSLPEDRWFHFGDI